VLWSDLVKRKEDEMSDDVLTYQEWWDNHVDLFPGGRNNDYATSAAAWEASRNASASRYEKLVKAAEEVKSAYEQRESGINIPRLYAAIRELAVVLAHPQGG